MYDVPQDELVKGLSEELKGKIKTPEWAMYVKTGMHKERPPVNREWWYARAASVLRQVHLKGPVGVSKLRFKYGGKKRNRGMQPEHFYKGSGKIIRVILQQLEEAKLIKQDQKGLHKGRVLTKQGKTLLHNTANKVASKPAPKKEDKKAKAEEKKEDEKETVKEKSEKKEKPDKESAEKQEKGKEKPEKKGKKAKESKKAEEKEAK